MYVSVKPKKFTINISLAVQSLKMPNKRNYVQLSFGTGIIEINFRRKFTKAIK